MKKNIKKAERIPSKPDQEDESWQIDALHQPESQEPKKTKKLKENLDDKQKDSGFDEWSVSWP